MTVLAITAGVLMGAEQFEKKDKKDENWATKLSFELEHAGTSFPDDAIFMGKTRRFVSPHDP
jgi:hypothetical protein